MSKIKLTKFVLLFLVLSAFSPLFAQLEVSQEDINQASSTLEMLQIQEDLFNEEFNKQLQTLKDLEQNQVADSVSLTSIPNSPKPLQKVLLQLQSFGPDLNNSYITWIVNGSAEKAGNAEKTHQITLGKAGTVTNIQVIIQGQNVTIEKNMVLQPADVDLIFEARSYVPPFYKGKALYVAQGQVVVNALPYIIENGVRVNGKNLTYKWTKDGKVLGEMSGYGKNTLTLYGSIISRPMVISVEVTSPTSNTKAVGSVVVNPAQVKVLLYETNPLYGIQYSNALGREFIMKDNELTLIASPYFFSIEDKAFNKLSHKWTLNNKKVEEESGKNIITFRKPETVGVSQIALGIESDNKVLQSARNTVILKFEDEN